MKLNHAKMEDIVALKMFHLDFAKKADHTEFAPEVAKRRLINDNHVFVVGLTLTD